MEKITFIDGQVPDISAKNLNQIQTNVETAINEVETAINELKSSLIKIVSYDISEQSLSSSVNQTTEISIAQSDYTPIGIVEVNTNNNNITIQKFSIYNTTAYITLRNTTSSAQTYSGNIKVLYLRA